METTRVNREECLIERLKEEQQEKDRRMKERKVQLEALYLHGKNVGWDKGWFESLDAAQQAELLAYLEEREAEEEVEKTVGKPEDEPLSIPAYWRISQLAELFRFDAKDIADSMHEFCKSNNIPRYYLSSQRDVNENTNEAIVLRKDLEACLKSKSDAKRRKILAKHPKLKEELFAVSTIEVSKEVVRTREDRKAKKPRKTRTRKQSGKPKFFLTTKFEERFYDVNKLVCDYLNAWLAYYCERYSHEIEGEFPEDIDDINNFMPPPELIERDADFAEFLSVAREYDAGKFMELEYFFSHLDEFQEHTK